MLFKRYLSGTRVLWLCSRRMPERVRLSLQRLRAWGTSSRISFLSSMETHGPGARHPTAGPGLAGAASAVPFVSEAGGH